LTDRFFPVRHEAIAAISTPVQKKTPAALAVLRSTVLQFKKLAGSVRLLQFGLKYGLRPPGI
jgi:hypothetical protein